MFLLRKCPSITPVCESGSFLDRDVKPERLKLPDVPTDSFLGVAPIEVVGPKLLVGHARIVPSLSRANDAGHQHVLRRSLIILQQAAKPRATPNPFAGQPVIQPVDELVADPLMIPLVTIVDDEFRDRPPEVAFTEGNHSIETLLFD